MTNFEMNRLADLIVDRLFYRLTSLWGNAEDLKFSQSALPQSLVLNKPVIGMEDLRDSNISIIKIKKNSIITPLAKDHIREKKIEIQFI